MFKNYFTIAVRNLKKHFGYSVINIAGLAIGLACCMLILSYIKFELAYEKFNEKSDRIFRITSDFESKGVISRTGQTSPPIGPALKNNFPEITEFVRIYKRDKVLVKKDEKVFYEDQFYYTDESFFKVFDFNLVQGNKETALNDPASVIISKDASLKYFGSDNPLGNTISVEIDRQLKEFKITGILDDTPGPSDINPGIIIQFNNLGESWLSNWWGFGFSTFVLLDKKASPFSVEQKLTGFMERNYPKLEFESTPVLKLQPITDIHLYSDFEYEDDKLNPVTMIYLLVVLAVFILSIACINFMNLSTARSQGRAREVGVRKVIGAAKPQLIKQFLVESVIMAFVSLAIALFLVELLLPSFNDFAGKQLKLLDPVSLSGFFFITILVGLFSGIYPAVFLSKFRPVEVLKGKSGKAAGGALLRKILVTVQFVISIALIFGTIVVYSQLQYVKNKDLGYDKEHLIAIPLQSREAKNPTSALRNEIKSLPEVIDASFTSAFPYYDLWWRTKVVKEGDSDENRISVYTFQIDFNFFNTLGINFLAGRDFNQNYLTDSTRFIINESAAAVFGWSSPEEAIGKKISWLGRGSENPKTGEIAGVVKDFNFRSLHEPISPAVFHLMADPYEIAAVRIMSNSAASVIPKLEAVYKKFDPLHPFEFSFLDESVNREYLSTEKLGKIFTLFSCFAVFIACLGLFGLIAYTTEQRTKELGIRKVLGASISGIVFMLVKEFTRWVVIANIIAWPAAYFFMDKWLEDFAYRIDITLWMFVFSGAAALLIALLTVGFHAIKTALANPVTSLRYE